MYKEKHTCPSTKEQEWAQAAINANRGLFQHGMKERRAAPEAGDGLTYLLGAQTLMHAHTTYTRTRTRTR
jgi:hypothetical protein